MGGVADVADKIYRAGEQKPTTAFIDDIGASAAYWLASQANKVYANQTAFVGSIGVYTIYIDSSERAKREGFSFHIFRSGPHKGVGEPGIGISEENRSAIQSNIDAAYELFIRAILRGRNGLNENELRQIADGRSFIGAKAKELKLVDGIATLEGVLQMPMPETRKSKKSQLFERTDDMVFWDQHQRKF
jgi:signal peptide peptidase SppA